MRPGFVGRPEPPDARLWFTIIRPSAKSILYICKRALSDRCNFLQLSECSQFIGLWLTTHISAAIVHTHASRLLIGPAVSFHLRILIDQGGV